MSLEQLHVHSRDQTSSRRVSQLLPILEMGSLSSHSMPSSPISSLSSSSAIFERDIELILPIVQSLASLPQSHQPHHKARGVSQLDNSVPSVLDSAASILAEYDEKVAVDAPAFSSIDHGGRTSGFASPIGSFRSRSPSFGSVGIRSVPGTLVTPRTELLLSIPATPLAPIAPAPPFADPYHSHTAPSIITSTLTILPPSSHAASPSHSAGSLSHPPSPHNRASKRLSFMSYSDLLSSTPTSTQPLSSFTTWASSADPPPHIVSCSVVGAQKVRSTTASLRAFMMTMPGGMIHPGRPDSTSMLESIGGEWEREGLGRGLEERLEALMSTVGGNA